MSMRNISSWLVASCVLSASTTGQDCGSIAALGAIGYTDSVSDLELEPASSELFCGLSCFCGAGLSPEIRRFDGSTWHTVYSAQTLTGGGVRDLSVADLGSGSKLYASVAASRSSWLL